MNELFVSCTPGLEKALAEELRELGLAQVKSLPGGAQAVGSFEQVNLNSRLASRVLLRVGQVRQPAALQTLRLPLSTGVRIEGGDRSWQAAALAVWGEGDALSVHLRLHHGECVVSVDTSGELLHLRGYRQEIGRAPMRETLAAGVLRIARFNPALPLWDVMCGSGTLVIEAAQWAAGLAPGRNRGFAFEQWASRPPSPPALRGVAPIIGSDLNAGALGTARRNAKRAEVLNQLTLERLDATQLPAKPTLEPGLVVANLPYGKRVGERSALGSLYGQLGASLRRACAGWRFAFLLQEGAEHLGLPIDERAQVANGGLRCEVVIGSVPT